MAGANPVILGPDLVALLQDMGLSWDEVRIYQFLLNAPSSISSAIVRETGHARGRIYEALRRLVEKGLVREEPTRPIQFHATPLAEILATAQGRLTRQLDVVKASQAVALKTATPGVTVPLLRPTRPQDVRVLSGRKACQAECLRMLDGATSFFWLTGGGNLPYRLAAQPGFLHSLREAYQRGVNVQVVLPNDASNSTAVATVAALLGPEILHLAAVDQFGPLVSCATENAAMEIIAQPDDDVVNRGDDVGMQVSSELFANALKQRLTLAESLLKEDRAGPVYEWLGPDQGSDLFLEAVTAAKDEVLVLGPREWTTYLAQDWQQTAPLYEAAKKRGVCFRALTSPGEHHLQTLEQFSRVWDIRVAGGHPVWLTIVDGREIYQAFTHPSLGGPPQFRHSREPNEVLFYATVFERLWADGTPLGTPPSAGRPRPKARVATTGGREEQ